jgi:hypothetical protein
MYNTAVCEKFSTTKELEIIYVMQNTFCLFINFMTHEINSCYLKCNYVYIYISLLWCFGRIEVIASSFLWVSKQFRFYGVWLLALRPNPSYPRGPMVCFFLWFLTTNLPGMEGPTGCYTTASIAWCITEMHKPRHQLSKSWKP